MQENPFAHLEFAEPSATAATGRPWPRYFARMLDAILLGFVGSIILSLLLLVATENGLERFEALLAGPGSFFYDNVLVLALAFLPIALLLAFAQTPGKLLLGIRVRNSDGSRLSFSKALQREAWVLVRGLGLGLPLISFITLVMSHADLKNEGTTAWDRRLDCRVEHAPRTSFWWVRAILGASVVLASTAYAMFEQIFMWN